MSDRSASGILEQALGLLACPRCGAALAQLEEGLRCSACALLARVERGIPDLRLAGDPGGDGGVPSDGDARTEAVRAFYAQAPFPNYPPRDNLGSLRARAQRSAFARLLDQAIPGDARILEAGCGTGQLSLFLASADRLVVGADLTRASLELAEQARRRYGGLRALFVETDLRAPGLRERSFDVVISQGVLHHTPDPRASFAKLSKLAKPGGIVVIGLYNALARLPHRLRRGLARLSGFRWFPLDPVLRDRRLEPARREAWLRDQYRHVEEHRHTLAEVQGWFRESGVEYLRCFPGTLLGEEPPAAAQLFEPAADDWPPENLLAQLSWAATLGREGGLWVTLGKVSSSA